MKEKIKEIAEQYASEVAEEQKTLLKTLDRKSVGRERV